MRLHRDRPMLAGGLGEPVPLYITWSAVAEWCRHYGYGNEDLKFMDNCFRAMDAAYLEIWKVQAKARAAEAERKRRRGK